MPVGRIVLSAGANLAPLAGRGRVASRDAIRVRGYRSLISHELAEGAPHPNPLPVKDGERERACDAAGNYANAPSSFAAFQLRQKSCGIWMCVAPMNEKASLTALENAGTPPTFGLSPTPLAPIG
jgi:hypothetical protein